MEEKILFTIAAVAMLGAAAILLVGYGELKSARQCYAIVGVQP